MNEIDYRAWNVKVKMMLDLKKITPLALDSKMTTDGLFLPFTDDLILLQYTGLKDKNGAKIFVGDILGYDDGKRDNEQTGFERWIVKELGEWECTCADYYCQEDGIGFSIEGYHGYHRRSGETDKYYMTRSIKSIGCESVILGNIYKNPELIPSKDN